MRSVIGLLGIICVCGGVSTSLSAETCDGSPQEAFNEVAPSIVSILAVSIDPFSLPERVAPAIGSGVVIDDAGHVLTSAHIVYNSTSIAVTTGQNKIVEAALVGADPILDLAVLRLAEREGDLPIVNLGDSSVLEIGQEVLAVGHPFGLGLTATRGIVSGLDRVVRRSPMSWLAPLIQTDAAINPGNSGGPLVNLCGEVVGINTFRVERGTNIGFSVPINIAKEALPQLIREGRVIRPWHGIYGKIVDLRLLLLRVPLVPGFLIETVEPGSPAAEIGLRGGSFPVRIGAEEYLLGGDIITKVNGEPLTDLETAIRIVRSLEVGDEVAIEYFRDGTISTVEVVLPERPILPGDMIGAGVLQSDYENLPGSVP